MALPAEIQQLIDTALVSVQSHPKGELAQAYRRQIYDALWDQYADVCKWWGILAARRVQPIYEVRWSELIYGEHQTGIDPADNLEDEIVREIIRSAVNGHLGGLESLFFLRKADADRGYARRMLDIAEDALTGKITADYAGAVCSGYYYDVMGRSFQRGVPDGYFVLWAAHEALCTISGRKPLSSPVGEYIGESETGAEILWSTEWDDLKLVRKGGYAADAAVYAAYAFAFQSDTDAYDPEKLHEFWQWWLTESFQQAWDKAGKK